jgi:hypothetical protein
VRFVRILATCIDDKEEMIAPVRDHQIVEDAARRIGEKRIPLSPFAETQQIDRCQALERACHALAAGRPGADGELTHMRHIEETRCGTGVEMLFENAARKIDRHLVPRERAEASTELHVQVVKRGPLQFGIYRGLAI